MPLALRLLLTIATSFLGLAALPGGGAPFVVFVSLAPWLLALEGASARQGALLGLAGGAVGWLLSIRWLPACIGAYASLHPLTAWGATVLFCLYAAIPYGLFGWLRIRFFFRKGPVASLEASAVLAMLVHLFPSVLPGSPAHALYRTPELMQLAGVGGVFLVLWFVFAMNFLVADFLGSAWERRPRSSFLFLAATLFLAVWGGGSIRLDVDEGRNASEQDASLVVTGVQPNLPVSGDLGMQDGPAGGGLKRLMEMTREALARHPGTDLLVWPEIPLHLPSDPRSPGFKSIAALARELDVAILYQCTTVVERTDGGRRFHNSVRLATRQGNAGPRYDKSILVPFAEYLPLEETLPFLRAFFPGVGGYVPGEGPKVVPVASARIIPAICYEAIFSRFVGKGVALGGNVLVNVVDDAWFGDSPATHVHLAMGLFRSVEYAIPIVRVANAGAGVSVGANGRILPGSETGLFTEEITSVRIKMGKRRTPYSKYGDAGIVTITVLFLFALRVRVRFRKT